MLISRLLSVFALRTLLTLAGLGALCVSAFLWSVIAGWAAIGLSALLTEWAIRSETSAPPQ